MKVEVTYTETWRRKAIVDVDEKEVREWLTDSADGFPADKPVTGDDVQRFFDNTAWERVNDLGLPPWQIGEEANLPPGTRTGDEFYESDLDEAKIVRQD